MKRGWLLDGHSQILQLWRAHVCLYTCNSWVGQAGVTQLDLLRQGVAPSAAILSSGCAASSSVFFRAAGCVCVLHGQTPCGTLFVPSCMQGCMWGLQQQGCGMVQVVWGACLLVMGLRSGGGVDSPPGGPSPGPYVQLLRLLPPPVMCVACCVRVCWQM
jgi:hypothetical protein